MFKFSGVIRHVETIGFSTKARNNKGNNKVVDCANNKSINGSRWGLKSNEDANHFKRKVS